MLVLLVDDDQQSRETMGLILEMDGFKVCYAGNGRLALDRLKRKGPDFPAIDLIVLDLEMPETTGLDMLAELKTQNKNIPVMVVTGYASKSMVVELMRFGVKDFLDKPFQMVEFRSRIHQMAQTSLQSHSKIRTESGQSIVDITDLALPNTIRRIHSPPMGRDLVIACTKDHGYDILLATSGAKGMEAFSQIVQIKSFVDRNRIHFSDAPTCINELNKTLISGNLKRSPTQATFIRVFKAQHRLEVHNVGHPPCTYLDPFGAISKPQTACGSDLGLSKDIRIETFSLTYKTGDRLFLHTPGFEHAAQRNSQPTSTSSHTGSSIGIGHLFTSHRKKTLDQIVDNIWNEVLDKRQEGGSDDMFLWGIELV